MPQQLRLDQRYLTDEDAFRLYKRYPEMSGDFRKYCPTCFKKGFITWDGEQYPCDCKQQLQLNKHYLNAGIGDLYQRQTWDDFEGDPELIELISNYLEKSERMVASGIGLVLYGSFGIGKTMATNLMLKDLLKLGYPCYSTTFTNMIDMFTAGWTSQEEKIFFERKIRKTKILLLDDVGKEYKSKNNLGSSTFDSVLRSRTQDGLPTLITTNMTDRELTNEYGDAVMSLLKETSVLYEVQGTDFRSKAGQRKLHEVMAGNTRPID